MVRSRSRSGGTAEPPPEGERETVLAVYNTYISRSRYRSRSGSIPTLLLPSEHVPCKVAERRQRPLVVVGPPFVDLVQAQPHQGGHLEVVHPGRRGVGEESQARTVDIFGNRVGYVVDGLT